MSQGKIVEGVFAINKPSAISSAQVLRDLQFHFNSSTLFAPWLVAAKAARARESHNQRQRHRNKKIKVKIGHGGTLDPMATGVLITGVGSGTKKLQGFLECTKSYETVVLFGAATDTYDRAGKVLSRAPYSHITKEVVEAALRQFRGKIMQRPPIYSALRVQGKRLYQYAREGKEVPVEIQERAVEVAELELVDWMEGGAHPYVWPEEEAGQEEQKVAEILFHNEQTDVGLDALALEAPSGDDDRAAAGKRRKADVFAETDHIYDKDIGSRKKRRSTFEPLMSGALQPLKGDEGEARGESAKADSKSTERDESVTPIQESVKSANTQPLPPAVRLRMTVSSGFYVRSLCHDLGKAVGSHGIMSELVRTRQGQFHLGENVLEYDDLSKGEDVWGPKVDEMLRINSGQENE